MKHKFAVRAINACGSGTLSNVLEVDMTTKPDRMEPVVLTPMDPCGVLVSWKAPSDGGNYITGYRVEVRIAKSLWIDEKGNPAN